MYFQTEKRTTVAMAQSLSVDHPGGFCTPMLARNWLIGPMPGLKSMFQTAVTATMLAT